MIRKLARLPRRAWSWWVDVGLGVRVARWTGLAAALGYATAFTQWAVGSTLAAVIVGCVGGAATVQVIAQVARVGHVTEDRLRASEERAAGLQVVAQVYWDEQLRRAGKDRP